MEIKDVHEIRNLVFDRKEIEAKLISETSPSNNEVITFLSEKFSAPEDAIKLNGIHGRFGSREFKIKANIYKSKEEKGKVEGKTKTEKKEAEAEKKATEVKE